MTLRTSAQLSGYLWDTAAAWTPNGVPTATDDVVIGASSLLMVANGQAGSVTLADPGAVLDVDPIVTLSVSGSVNVNAGKLVLEGTLANATLSVNGGTLQYKGGILDNVTLATPLDLGALEPSVLYPSMFFKHTLTLGAQGQAGLRITSAYGNLQAGSLLDAPGLGAPAVLDGGIAVVGSSSPSAPVSITAWQSPITLGVGLSLDVIGAAKITGAGGAVSGNVVNAGTINVAPGGSLSISGGFSGTSTGTTHIASGTLDLSSISTTLSMGTPIQMDDSAARLVLETGQSVTVTGFRAGDTIDVKGSASTPPKITKTVNSVTIGSSTLTFNDAAAGAAYTTASDGAGGTLVTTTAVGAAAIGFVDQTTGATGSHWLDQAVGGPSYLQWQYIDAGPDTMALSSATPNVFLHGGSGEKSMAVTSGKNVLDGGTGSSFLTGGSGTDTFFVDARYSSPVWDTIRNFHAGDAVTVWGWVPGVNSMTVDASAGAAGSEGATLRILNGAGSIVASVTFSGMSADQVGHLQQATGTQGPGRTSICSTRACRPGRAPGLGLNCRRG